MSGLGSSKAEISRRLLCWYEADMGIRPSKVSIASDEEMVFVRFKDAIWPSEINLGAGGQGKGLIREVNERLCEHAFGAIKGIIFELTGAELLELHVEDNVHLHEKVYVLTLDRPV